MPQLDLNKTVYEASVDRMTDLYKTGAAVSVSFSGGKDSGVCLEVTIIAAERTGNLPVHVVMRDEEIMFPGTFEYCLRVAARPEVDFHWIYACQPVINMFDRELPYWWVFDPLLSPDKWVRKPPDIAYLIPEKNILDLCTKERFDVPAEQELYNVVGLRTVESINRRRGLFSSGSWITKPDRNGVRGARPIYDWRDDDVWAAMTQFGWDYNTSYDVMHRFGINKHALRTAPPTMDKAGIRHLQMAAKAWPQWYSRVSDRIPGMRILAKFGKDALDPKLQLNETWEECYQRTCIDTAPAWVAERARIVQSKVIGTHSKHATTPFPHAQKCAKCGTHGCWRVLTAYMWNGHPFMRQLPTALGIDVIEPEFFRPGSGVWDGKPSF